MKTVLTALTLAAVLGQLTACGGGGGAEPATALAEDTSAAVDADGLTRRARLGQRIFNDRNLSEPAGTACVSCHRPDQGFAGNNGSRIGVPLGSTGALGLRNAMTNAYSGFVPGFSIEKSGDEIEAIGGHFWDGRADTLEQQALGPFLNPAEMNNASAASLMAKIAASGYANQFRQEFGATVFNDPVTAFQQVGVAIAAFERSPLLQAFSSKYDAVIRGQASFNAQEQRGLALFRDPARANCAGCHAMDPGSARPQDSLFSDFSYYATGIPRNTAIPANADASFYDLGLCGPNRTAPAIPAALTAQILPSELCGKFRMPSLRNVAERPAFMHNGFFSDLREVVRFYATRASNPERWYGPSGAPNDLPAAYRANLESGKAPFNRSRGSAPLLSETEINDIVAFLRTLSDGYTPAPVRPPLAGGGQ